MLAFRLDAGLDALVDPFVLVAPIDVAFGLVDVGRPPPKPNTGPPIDSIATLPARMNRSAQLIDWPYFCLIGHSSRRALSRLPLSGQMPARYLRIRDRRRQRLLREAAAPERGGRRRARRRAGSAQRDDGTVDGCLVRRRQQSDESPPFTFHLAGEMHRDSHRRDGLRLERQPERALRERHRQHRHLVRRAVRHQAFQRFRACQRVQPVLVDAGGHRGRHRPHGFHVRHEGQDTLQGSRQRQGRRADHAEAAQPAYAQVGMVAFPPVKTTSTSVCDAPYNSLGNGWDGYDRTQPRLCDRRDERQLQAERRLEPGLRPGTPHDGRPGQRVHPGRWQHVLHRGAPPGQGRTGQERPPQGPRLHHFPHRRRGQPGQRLRREQQRLSARWPRGSAALSHRDRSRQRLQAKLRRDDLQHRVRARHQRLHGGKVAVRR